MTILRVSDALRIASIVGSICMCVLDNNALAQTRFVDIYAAGYVRLLVVDPLGRKLGYESKTGRYYTEIPGGNIGASSIGILSQDDTTNQNTDNGAIVALINDALDGEYSIVVAGTRAGFFDVNVHAGHMSKPITNVACGGLIDSLLTMTFKFSYNFAHAVQDSPSKVYGSSVLRQDMNCGFKLQMLGSGSFYGNLSQQLDFLEAYLARSDSWNVRRVLEGFRADLDLARHQPSDTKFITADLYGILSDDVGALLKQLPPTPVIASLIPSTTIAGGNGFSLTVKGKAFVPASAVLWNGSPRTTSFAADSVLQATILASDIASPGTASVAVVNPGNDTSNALPFTITQPPSGLTVNLINSVGTNLTGGSLQYYDGSWKDAVNNNDGTFHVNTTLASVSLRMTYEGGSQTKSNVAVGPNVVVFQTVNTQVKLQNSQGALIDTGTVQYYYSSWQALGRTMNGAATKELLPANYTFRMTYATATNDKQQDIGANPTVVFTTVNAAVQLKNSAGSFIDQGTVQYYFSSWQALGNTINGVAMKELLPGNYTFRMSYASATNDKQQNISSNPTVVFQTVSAAVQLKNSSGSLIDQGTVQYYFSSWQSLGTTTNGVAMKELLPGSYTFRMAYETVTNDKVQNIATNSTVSFSTVLCTVTVKNGQGQPVDGAQVSYYFSSWRTIGATVGGLVTKELLPASLTFRETIGAATQNKAQNIGTNALVEFVVQ